MFDQQVTQNSPQSIVPDNAPCVECCSAGEMTNLQQTNFSLTAAASIF
jgi:hypothetical protein